MRDVGMRDGNVHAGQPDGGREMGDVGMREVRWGVAMLTLANYVGEVRD